MTPDTLEFLLRLTVVWAALLVFYYAALRSAPFWFQRYYLLGALVAGVVIPLLPAVGGGLSVAGLPAVTFVAEPFYVAGSATPVTDTTNWSWPELLTYTYLFLTTLFLARTLVQWREIWQWWRGGQREVYNAYPVVRHPAIGGPFVAFGCIFLPASLPDDQLETTALLHETAHLRSRHHYDTLLLTLGGWLLWFHPLFWVLRRQLTTVHEYEADAAVIQRVPVRTYGLQLLQHSLGPAGYPGLFSSPLKLRIDMITDNTRVRSLGLLPLLLLCFLLAGLFVACSDMGETVAIEQEQYSPVPLLGLSPTDAVSEYPRLKKSDQSIGAPEALIKEIYKEIRYPAEARKTGEIGRVSATLVIDNNGKVLDISIIRELPVSESFDEDNSLTIIGAGDTSKSAVKEGSNTFVKEVNRTIQALGDFKPATKDGKAIAVQIQIDFNFMLE